MPVGRYTYRTLRENPTEYERALCESLLSILSRSIHGLPEIVRELNRLGPKAGDGRCWTEEHFAAEMGRLGNYPNCTGAPLGAHAVGISFPAAKVQTAAD